MKRVFGVLLVSMLLLGAVSLFADAGCCAGGGAATVANCFTNLNLTADQKAKVAALQVDCKSGCNMAAHEKLAAGLKAILTPEQYAQWTKDCEQAKGASKCPAKAQKTPAPNKN